MTILIGKRQVKTYKEAGLGIPFQRLIQKRQEFKEQIDTATAVLGDKKRDDPNNPGLNWQIESILESKGLDAVIAGEWIVTRSSSKSVTIPREGLAQAMLEAGIDSEIIDAVIDAATNTVPYTYIQVTRPKELEQRAAEKGFDALPAKVTPRSGALPKGYHGISPLPSNSLVSKLKSSIADVKKRKRA